MKKLKFIPIIMFILFSVVAIRMIRDKGVDYNVELGNTMIPMFDTVELSFKHSHNKKKSLPFMASSIIDIDGDGTEEVFLGGGFGQEDKLFKYKNASFHELVDVLPKKNNQETTLGSIAFDSDYDGDLDMLITLSLIHI